MRWRKILHRTLALLLLVSLAVLGVSWWMGGSLLATAPRIVGPGPAGLPIQATTLDSASGSTLATWYIPAENSSATIVLLHPIRGSRLSMLSRAELFHRCGYSIVM